MTPSTAEFAILLLLTIALVGACVWRSRPFRIAASCLALWCVSTAFIADPWQRTLLAVVAYVVVVQWTRHPISAAAESQSN